MDYRERVVKWRKPRSVERKSHLARERQNIIDWISPRRYSEFGVHPVDYGSTPMKESRSRQYWVEEKLNYDRVPTKLSQHYSWVFWSKFFPSELSLVDWTLICCLA